MLNRTAADSGPRYRRCMELQNNTIILAAIHVAMVGVGGVAAGITSASAWVALSALALLPACSMLIIWSQPSQALLPPPRV